WGDRGRVNRPAWTLAEAAERCSISRSTIKRRLSAGELPNAYKTSSGQWRIPVTDLIAAGYDPGKVEWSDPEQPTPSATSEPQQGPSEARLRELEQELAQERLRRANAEQIAEERRARIEDLQMAMRLLEAPAREGGSQGGPPGSNRRTTGPGHGPSDPGHDLGQSGSSQVKDGSGEPSEWTTGIDQDGPPGPLREPRRRQGWWARLIGKSTS